MFWERFFVDGKMALKTPIEWKHLEIIPTDLPSFGMGSKTSAFLYTSVNCGTMAKFPFFVRKWDELFLSTSHTSGLDTIYIQILWLHPQGFQKNWKGTRIDSLMCFCTNIPPKLNKLWKALWNQENLSKMTVLWWFFKVCSIWTEY